MCLLLPTSNLRSYSMSLDGKFGSPYRANFIELFRERKSTSELSVDFCFSKKLDESSDMNETASLLLTIPTACKYNEYKSNQNETVEKFARKLQKKMTKKQKSKEQMGRGGSKPSKSAKRTKSNKSMQSGKSAKSQSMGLVADEQMGRGGSKPSAKRTKSNKSMQSGKSAKSQSMGLVADPTQSASSSKSAKGSRSPRKIENKMTEDKPTQSASSSKSAKGSRSPRKIENKMTEDKVNLIHINPYLQLIDSYHFARIKKATSSATKRRKQVMSHFSELITGDQLDLILEPSNLFWKPAGGIKKVEVSNPGNERQAIKVKCTDNDLYRVNPVYAFIEPGQTVSFDIVRNNGGNKNDKLVFLATKASNNDTRPKELFKPGASNAVMVLPLLSVAA
uniref:Major sperm protein n=1 Tax=Ascaris lumbricoides TaxID=6252 RepID=A0A9J2PIQ0_ASCLU